jgi:hypothetical protein
VYSLSQQGSHLRVLQYAVNKCQGTGWPPCSRLFPVVDPQKRPHRSIETVAASPHAETTDRGRDETRDSEERPLRERGSASFSQMQNCYCFCFCRYRYHKLVYSPAAPSHAHACPGTALHYSGVDDWCPAISGLCPHQ